jgi:dTDP-4-dehydrorhamnose reductase
MRVLVTGATGQVGRELVAHLGARGHHEVLAPARPLLDLAERDSVLGVICANRPDLVLHAGAFTAVDRCESEVDLAYQVNALGTRHVADAARRVGAHVVYVSTDYVFDGTKPGPYVEWDTPNPQSVYGRSKLGGEAELDPGSTVVRVSWVCGYHGTNMVKTVLRLLGQGDGPLRFVDDQRGHPTFADDLAAMLVRLGVERRPGTFHVTNQGPVSWYEFVRDIVALAGGAVSRVEPISSAELTPPRPAPRPANSVLDNAALRLSGLPLLPDFHEPLERLLKRLTAD